MRSTLETEAETGVEDRPSRRAALRVVVFVLAFVGAIGAMVGAAWVYGGRDGATPMDMGTEGMGAMDMGAATAHASAAPLPGTVAGLPMVEAITGPEAVEQVSMLHGTDIPVVWAAVGRYEGPDGRAEVWASGSGDRASAVEMTRQMLSGIREGGTPFGPPRRVASERGVWATRGMGQTHYFFARGGDVWWVSADGAVARRALEDALLAAA